MINAANEFSHGYKYDAITIRLQQEYVANAYR